MQSADSSQGWAASAARLDWGAGVQRVWVMGVLPGRGQVVRMALELAWVVQDHLAQVPAGAWGQVVDQSAPAAVDQLVGRPVLESADWSAPERADSGLCRGATAE
jgi:hypothetical protein